jgi:hypothetical protein
LKRAAPTGERVGAAARGIAQAQPAVSDLHADNQNRECHYRSHCQGQRNAGQNQSG